MSEWVSIVTKFWQIFNFSTVTLSTKFAIKWSLKNLSHFKLAAVIAINTANFLENVTVKEFLQSVHFDKVTRKISGLLFWLTTCIEFLVLRVFCLQIIMSDVTASKFACRVVKCVHSRPIAFFCPQWELVRPSIHYMKDHLKRLSTTPAFWALFVVLSWSTQILKLLV